MKISENDRKRAKAIAIQIEEAHNRGDMATRNQLIPDLKQIIGYWPANDRLTTKEFRGESIPPMRYVTPSGHTHKFFTAQEKWACSE